MAMYFEYDKRRAMKQTDFTPCAKCGKGVMHTGSPIFYRVTIERMGIDGSAVQRQHGLEMVLGGHAAIAHIMGPNDDIGLPVGPPSIGLLCSLCAHKLDLSFSELTEILLAKEDAR